MKRPIINSTIISVGSNEAIQLDNFTHTITNSIIVSENGYAIYGWPVENVAIRDIGAYKVGGLSNKTKG